MYFVFVALVVVDGVSVSIYESLSVAVKPQCSIVYYLSPALSHSLSFFPFLSLCMRVYMCFATYTYTLRFYRCLDRSVYVLICIRVCVYECWLLVTWSIIIIIIMNVIILLFMLLSFKLVELVASISSPSAKHLDRKPKYIQLTLANCNKPPFFPQPFSSSLDICFDFNFWF